MESSEALKKVELIEEGVVRMGERNDWLWEENEKLQRELAQAMLHIEGLNERIEELKARG